MDRTFTDQEITGRIAGAFGIDSDGERCEVDYQRNAVSLTVTCIVGKTRMAELRCSSANDNTLLEFDVAAGFMLRTDWNRKTQRITRNRRPFALPEGLGLPQRGPYSRTGWLSGKWWLPGAKAEPVAFDPQVAAQRLDRITTWSKKILKPYVDRGRDAHY